MACWNAGFEWSACIRNLICCGRLAVISSHRFAREGAVAPLPSSRRDRGLYLRVKHV